MDAERSRQRSAQDEEDPYREAFQVLLEARERLLRKMSEEVLAHRDTFLDAAGSEDTLGFELQDLEDRYSARLHALNALIDNLEYRRPRVEHKVRVLRATVGTLERAIAREVEAHADWDLVGVSVARLEGDQILAVVAFTSEVYDD